MNSLEHTAGPFTEQRTEKSREELAGCRQAHPHWRQEVGGGERGKLGPRDGTLTKLQTGSQFLTKDFMRFWMVDICREGRR